MKTPNTYTQINIHCVFAVKGKNVIIPENRSDELFKYISGILKNNKQYPLAVGGYKNHVYIFFEMTTGISLGEIMNKIKSNSSKWINEEKMIVGNFEWQNGYGGFSYSKSQRNNVIQYIINQKKHHKERTFREEYMEMLQKFEIKYEDAYLFEFYE